MSASTPAPAVPSPAAPLTPPAPPVTPAPSATLGTTATQRLLAAAGLAYPVLTVIGFAAFPEPPGGDVSAAHDPGWLAAHTGAVIAQAYVRGFGTVGFVALALAVGSALGRRSPRHAPAAVAGGVVCGAFLLAAQTCALAAAFAARDGVGGVQLLDGLNEAFLAVSTLPAVLLFAAAGLAWWRGGGVPSWVAVLTLLGVPLSVLDALSYRGGPLAAVGAVGLFYFLLWSLLAALLLARAGQRRVSS